MSATKIASRDAKNESSGDRALANTAFVPLSDIEESHSNLNRKRSMDSINDYCYASDPQVRQFQRTKLSSSSVMDSEEKTIFAKTTILLGGDLFDAILAFLPVDHLVTLRSISKDTKAAIDAMIEKRARLPEDLEFAIKNIYNREWVKKEIWINTVSGERLPDRNTCIDHTVEIGNVANNFGAAEADMAKNRLLAFGRASKQDTVNGAFVGYDLDLFWSDSVEITMALKVVAEYFREMEDCNYSLELNNYNIDSLSDEEKQQAVAFRRGKAASRGEDGRKILLAKDSIMSLLLTNARNTVSVRRMKGEDETLTGMTLLFIQLSNGWKIAFNSETWI